MTTGVSENKEYIRGTHSIEEAFESNDYLAIVNEVSDFFSENKQKKKLVHEIYLNEKMDNDQRIDRLKNLYYSSQGETGLAMIDTAKKVNYLVENNNYIAGNSSIETAFEEKNYQAIVTELLEFCSDKNDEKLKIMDIFLNANISQSDKILELESLYYPSIANSNKVEKDHLKVKGILH